LIQELINKVAAFEIKMTSTPTLLKLDRETVQTLFAPSNSIDFKALRSIAVDRGEPVRARGRRPDFADHLQMLAQEFSGQPVLHFYHAALNAHIRREIQLEDSLKRFWDMWHSEKEYLLKNLNSRWLKSSSDTILCHAACDIERAAATAGSLLINTIKLYETERLAIGVEERPYAKVGTQPLFDGITAFVIGSGDMFVDLVDRSCRPYPADKISPRIMQELIKRAFSNPTVFNRLLKVHRVDLTRLHSILDGI
jgi:hypothetical protein